MLVDVIFPGWVPFPYLAVSKDIAGYIKAHDIVLENYEFDTFVGGHLTRLGTVEDVKIQKDFISDLQIAAAKANNEILLSDIAKQVGGFKNPWAVFAKYNDAVDERIAQEISPKWKDKLGGGRDVIKSHGFAMSEAGRYIELHKCYYMIYFYIQIKHRKEYHKLCFIFFIMVLIIF